MTQAVMFRPPAWMDDAACLGNDPAAWDLTETKGQLISKDNRLAVKICAECPVRADCEQYGRELRVTGVIMGQVAFASKGPQLVPMRNCIGCGQRFAAYGKQRSCSNNCAQLARYWRERSAA